MYLNILNNTKVGAKKWFSIPICDKFDVYETKIRDNSLVILKSYIFPKKVRGLPKNLAGADFN